MEQTKGKTANGREYSIKGGPVDDSQCYPHVDHHVWSEFAGLAIEVGGYNDITAIDPYTGYRFWLGHAFWCDEHAAAVVAAEPGDAAMAIYAQSHGCENCGKSSVIAAIRRLLDAMEQAGFPDQFRQDPKGRDEALKSE